MNGKVGIVATFLGSIEEIRERFKIDLPGVRTAVILDDDMLMEALTFKGHTPSVVSRMCGYFRNAEAIGCDCILSQCSSMGEAADIAAKTVRIPLFKIDYPMMKEAVTLGKNIAVIATAISTVGPSTRLAERAAADLGKQVTVRTEYVENAYDAVLGGDKATHDRLVTDHIRKVAEECDVIVLAQGSLFRLLPQLGDVKTPILSSTISGVAQLKPFFNGHAT